MKKFKIRYVIFTAILLILAFNEGNRTLLRRFFEQYKLKENIKSAYYQNDLLKKRIYYLENEPSYLEKMVRSELNVTAQDEIEYRFSTPK
ncbi:MAG: septum formation initiator family protein [Endomicrobium sp.]|jgi:cell division protein FtsB|nr:septum formation initiator family protein [Endomicrobium sp.]